MAKAPKIPEQQTAPGPKLAMKKKQPPALPGLPPNFGAMYIQTLETRCAQLNAEVVRLTAMVAALRTPVEATNAQSPEPKK